MSGVNKAIILGNVGQDPEVRFMPDGKAVANISIATSESWTDKNTGQKQEKTEWHRCNAFGRLAEIIQQYVKKGSKLYIEGSIHTRKWQDQQGQDKYSTEIKIHNLQMLDSKNTQQAPVQQAPQQNYGDSGQAPQTGHPHVTSSAPDFDDDIPF